MYVPPGKSKKHNVFDNDRTRKFLMRLLSTGLLSADIVEGEELSVQGSIITDS
jgi:hypothetical protein